MSGWLTLDRIAAARGDGLLPELRVMLERRAALTETGSTVTELNGQRVDAPVQAGPNPAGRSGAFLPGNVVPAADRFRNRPQSQRKSACTSQ